MKHKLLVAGLSAVWVTGCFTPTEDVSGGEFVQIVERGKVGEKLVLRRDFLGRYYYADWYRMPPTQSIFKFEKRYRASARELTGEKFEALKKKRAEQDAHCPWPH